MIPLSEALRLDPAEPRTPYRNLLGIAHYLAREYSTAAGVFEENLLIGGPAGPHMDVLRASTYAEMGEDDKAKAIIRDLVQSHPEFPAKNWLATWLQNSDHQPAIMNNLYRLGLQQSQ